MTLCYSASAFCEQPRTKICQVIFANDLVVRANVERTEIIQDEDDPEGVAGWRYDLKVQKTYRGQVSKSVVVTSLNTTSRLLLTTGKEYIVFASKSAGSEYEAGNYYGEVQGIDGEPFSSQTEKKIVEVLNGTSSVIEGEVRDSTWKLASGAVLTISGEESKTVTVGIGGSFRIEVKPGTYRITAPPNLRVTIYSPDGVPADPYSNEIAPITLVGGQCMQIQLQEQ